jgi:hypothetical protein
MLEAPTLLIHPWQPDNSGPHAWTRRITDGSASVGLGRVHWLGPGARSWFAWLRGQRMEVLETDDAALLMTLVRPWGLSRLWDVYDAEERRVGAIAAPVLLDSEGGRRGYLDRPERDCGRILDPTSQLLAEYAARPDQVVQLRFAARDMNPFLRMLLLGCVLVQQASPALASASR